MKQKMIEAMEASYESTGYKTDDGWYEPFYADVILDAALSVAADPANWTEEMENVSANAAMHSHAKDFEKDTFAAVINHIKDLPS